MSCLWLGLNWISSKHKGHMRLCICMGKRWENGNSEKWNLCKLPNGLLLQVKGMSTEINTTSFISFRGKELKGLPCSRQGQHKGLRPIATHLMPSRLFLWNTPTCISLLSKVKKLQNNYLCCLDAHSYSILPSFLPPPSWMHLKHSFSCSFQFGSGENTCRGSKRFFFPFHSFGPFNFVIPPHESSEVITC